MLSVRENADVVVVDVIMSWMLYADADCCRIANG
jgi:hypothetical protein